MKFKDYRIRTKLSRLPDFIISFSAILFVTRRLIFRGKLILIMTPGKVGSSSLYYSLLSKTNRSVFHIHYLTSNSISKEFYREKNSSKKGASWHLYVSYWINLYLKILKPDFDVIILVRKGSSRYLSSIFQNLNQLPKDIFDLESGSINYIKLKNYVLQGVDIDISNIYNYFNSELFTNFDLNNEKLEINKVYNHFGKSNVKILYTSLFYNDHMQNINIFLNTKIKKLERANIGNNKFYSKTYSKIKKELGKSLELKYSKLDSYLGFR